MSDTHPPSPLETDLDETERLRDLVELVRVSSVEMARVHATLIRQRAGIMQIALAQVARATSRASRERELPVRSVALEIAVATRTHDLTVQKELADAHSLTEKFAATVDALEAGRISPRHAHAVLDTGIVIDDEDARRGWERVVLSRAERDSPGRLRAFARDLAESVQPVGMTVRHARAAATRGVSVRDLADGMAELSVILPATVAYGIRDRLRRQAAAILASTNPPKDSPDDVTATNSATAHLNLDDALLQPGRGDSDAVEETDQGAVADSRRQPSRSDRDEAQAAGQAAVADSRRLAQIGADVCADLLLTAAPSIDPTDEATCPGGLGAIRGSVQITVPVLTLLGHADAGATVAGRSPIDPASARVLAAHAPGWDRVMIDPVSGTVLEVDRYTPTAAQRRYLAARDQHCRAPGCRAPVSRCQLDHNHEAQHGGSTKLTNLCHLCVRHHTLKTETAWTVTQDADGTLRFHSPLGQQVSEKPPPRVVFLPDDLAASHCSNQSEAPPF